MLDRMLHNPSTVKVIVNLFLKDVPPQIERLSACLEKGDLDQVKFLSHVIKGSALNVSSDALKAIAFAIEQEAVQGNTEKIASLFPRMVTIHAELEKRLTGYLAELDDSGERSDPPN